MAAEMNELMIVSTKIEESKNEEEFSKIDRELSKRVFQRQPAIFRADAEPLFKEVKGVQLKDLSAEVTAGTSFGGRLLSDEAEPRVDLVDEMEVKKDLPESSTETISSHPDAMGSKFGSQHESAGLLVGPELTNFKEMERGMTPGTLAPPVGITDIVEDVFLHNEDLNEEDRNKAVAWAAAAEGVQHIGFLPECVLETGFKIKKFKLWMSLQVSVDYQHKRLTMMCPDTLSDVLLRRIVAHRIEVGDVRMETPVSRKRGPHQSRSSSGSTGSAPIVSKRRVNIIRTDGQAKYRLIAPTTEYRDRFLDILFMMSGPPLGHLKTN